MSNTSKQSQKSLIERILYFFGYVRRRDIEDTNIEPIDDGEFYRKHGLKHTEKIKEVKRIAPTPNQPGFIKFMKINGKEVAFLGTDISPDKLRGKFMRLNQMVIPESARMVKADILSKKVEDFEKNDGAIELTSDLFYPGTIEKGVLLNISGMIREKRFRDHHFHPCVNKSPSYRKSDTGSLTCPDPVTSPEEGEELENSGFSHQQIIFHIGTKELNKPEGCFYRPGTLPEQENLTIAQMIRQYFTDDHYPETHSDGIDWKKNKHLEGGVFLIPMSMPDDQIIYLCLLNIPGKANQNRSVRSLLHWWLHQLEAYNNNPDRNQQWLDIAGNDFAHLYLDEWSVSICKNALLKTGYISEIFTQEVVDSIEYAAH